MCMCKQLSPINFQVYKNIHMIHCRLHKNIYWIHHTFQFLNEHGGMSNAYTSSENTNYFFDVRSENLDGALDRYVV